MGPPKKYRFHLDFDKFWWKIKLTLIALGINSAMVLVFIGLAYLVLDASQIKIIISKIRGSGPYMNPLTLGGVLIIIRDYVIIIPVREEFLFRYPILRLVKNSFELRIRYDLTKLFLFISALGLNLIWAFGLKIGPITFFYRHPTPLSVFISGITLYWLTVKTRSMWPAVVCHAASNLILYLFGQSLLYFKWI